MLPIKIPLALDSIYHANKEYIPTHSLLSEKEPAEKQSLLK
jgi:hypothetical protein